MRRLVAVSAVAMFLVLTGAGTALAASSVTLSQVYGGGGNNGATLKRDFIEVFNGGTTAAPVDGWSVQYLPATASASSNWQATPLNGSIPAGKHFLAGEGLGTGGTDDLPTVDADGSIAMSGTAGIVALVDTLTPLTCKTTAACLATGHVIDLVGYGPTAVIFEGAAPAPGLTNPTAGVRAGNGCTDTDNNGADFTAGTPVPRNLAAAATPCGGTAPFVLSSSAPADGATGFPAAGNPALTFSRAATLDDGFATITCATSGPHAFTVGGGPASYTLDPATDFTPGESCTLAVTAAKVHAADDPGTTLPADVSIGFTIASPVAIHTIQGAAHRSPLLSQTVNTSGIVTVRTTNGFWIQDPSPDDDVATSEGVFVFTSSAPPATAAVGNSVAVTGLVSEFRPGGAATNLSTTELTGPTVTLLSTGNALPDATVVGPGGRTPSSTVIDDDATNVEVDGSFDATSDGIDFYESLEGMRVQLNDAVAAGPTNSFGELPLLPAGGAGASLRTPRGGIIVRPGDFNPERVIVTPAPPANVGDTFPGATVGVLDYNFGNFMLEVTSLPTKVDNGLTQETTTAPAAGQLAFATFNVENLDPGDPQSKFDQLAALIVSNLKAPDLLSIEEVQDDNGATDNGVVTAGDTMAKLIAAITAAGGPAYSYRLIDPVNDLDGGEPGGNIRVAFLFRTDRGLAFVDRPGGTATSAVGVDPGPELTFSPGRVQPNDSAFTTSRKPLAGEFTYGGQKLFVIANHWNSKGGDDPLYGPRQPPVLSSEVQRNKQATIVHDFVASILAQDAGARVIVLGDLNDFGFSNPVKTLVGTPPILEDLLNRLPADEQYSYVFEGNSQTLDHILVSPGAASAVKSIDAVHVNAEFAVQASDHDPLVAVADFNTSGPEPACDAALSAVGCWAFEETSGTNALDSSPFHNDGTYAGGPKLGVKGVIGKAVSMDGVNDNVTVPDSASLDVGDSFSLEGWIKRDENGHTHQLFNKGTNGLQLVVMDRFNGNEVWLRKAGVSTIVRTVGNGIPVDGRFHQVIATKNGPDSTKIYIDGVLQTLATVSPTQVIEDTDEPLSFSATPTGNPVKGDLDEYAVYDRALTAAEVTARFQRGVPATGASASAGLRSGAAKKSATARRRAVRAKRAVRSLRRTVRVARAERSARSVRPTAHAAAVASRSCAAVGTSTSGITDITVSGPILCFVARTLTYLGSKTMKSSGFTCTITGEDFTGPVVRVNRDCSGVLGLRVQYTTLS